MAMHRFHGLLPECQRQHAFFTSSLFWRGKACPAHASLLHYHCWLGKKSKNMSSSCCCHFYYQRYYYHDACGHPYTGV